MFPSLSQYNRTIQKQGANTFKTLTNLFFIPAKTLPIKIYNFGSGSFAVVFKALENSKEIAIRCFIGTDNDYVEHYKNIDNYLRNINESWQTNIQFLDNEIKVDGVFYPVLRMDWVEGKLLNDYINDNLYNNEILTKLQEQFVYISNNLEENKISHGDIQCGNIIVKEINSTPKIKLIDYDGLYIPNFSGEIQKEGGRSEFQHPKRSSFEFNEKLDRFSFWVILCALEALKYDKTLWKEIMQGGFNTLDNMLFVGNDFSNPNESKLFNRLQNLNQPTLTFYVEKIKLALNTSNIHKLTIYGQTETIEETPPVIYPKESRLNYLPVYIVSNPSGASVRDENFKNIGNTPITLDKNKYLNTEIKIIYGTQCKSFVINEFTNDINIDFNTIIQPPKLPKPQELPIAQPSSNDNSLIIIGVFVLLFLIILAAINVNKDKIPDAEATFVDTTAVVVDSAAAIVDSAYSVNDETAVDTTAAIVDTVSVSVNYDTSPTNINSNNNITLTYSDFIGKWQFKNSVFTFYSDGSCYIKWDSGSDLWSKWSIIDNNLYVGFGDNNFLELLYISKKETISFRNIGADGVYNAVYIGN